MLVVGSTPPRPLTTLADVVAGWVAVPPKPPKVKPPEELVAAEVLVPNAKQRPPVVVVVVAIPPSPFPKPNPPEVAPPRFKDRPVEAVVVVVGPNLKPNPELEVVAVAPPPNPPRVGREVPVLNAEPPVDVAVDTAVVAPPPSVKGLTPRGAAVPAAVAGVWKLNADLDVAAKSKEKQVSNNQPGVLEY